MPSDGVWADDPVDSLVLTYRATESATAQSQRKIALPPKLRCVSNSQRKCIRSRRNAFRSSKRVSYLALLSDSVHPLYGMRTILRLLRRFVARPPARLAFARRTHHSIVNDASPWTGRKLRPQTAEDAGYSASPDRYPCRVGARLMNAICRWLHTDASRSGVADEGEMHGITAKPHLRVGHFGRMDYITFCMSAPFHTNPGCALAARSLRKVDRIPKRCWQASAGSPISGWAPP
jgi:hypothetical protein